MGLEPTTTGITIRDSNQLSYAHHKILIVAGYYTRDKSTCSTLKLARPAGVEPATTSLEGWCSIQLSYGRQRNARTLHPKHHPRAIENGRGRGI
jgi:hypothetical protein